MDKDLNTKRIMQLSEVVCDTMKIVSYHLKDIHTTGEQPMLLHVINRYGPMTQKEIANKMKIKPATLTPRLQRLEKCNYISRKVDKADKRVQFVQITNLGKENLITSSCVIKDISNMVFDGFNQEEFDNLEKIIQKMKSNINKYKD